jgi:hypothetical protein
MPASQASGRPIGRCACFQSLEDDFYRTFAAARFIASKIPGARLLTYATGGHIWVGHDEELFAEVDAFIRKNQFGQSSEFTPVVHF